MTAAPDPNAWVWVIVLESPGGARYFGRQDPAAGLAYIPAFREKDDALACLPRFPAVSGERMEVQAVLFGELCRDAALNGFLIFMLGADGRVLDRITPPPARS
jgi:hypothetical protein